MQEPWSTARRGGRPRRALAAGALIALLVATVGCSGDDDDDATSSAPEAPDAESAQELLGPEDVASGEPVRLGMVSDGATDAFDNRDELRASEAVAAFWNERRGGVGGRPIEVVTCETGGDPAGATDCANQLVEQDVVGVALSQSAVADSVWEPLHAAGIPTMWFQTSSQGIALDTESSFAIVNPLTTLFGLPISVAEQEGTDKIAFVVIDVPQAIQGVEALGPSILGEAGLEYDLIPIAPGTADMTTQMQQVASSGAGVVQITGNDAFCIAALNGLSAVGYEGAVTVVNQCITDATREAVPGDVLDGVFVTSTIALGAADDPTYQLYRAVMDTYGDEVGDVENATAMGGYVAMGALATALGAIEGDITAESVAAAIKAMPEAELPGGGGVTFQCGGSAIAMMPAVCTNQWLQTQLDAEGRPTAYEPVDSTDILP
jgi:branched-chain amino acid transport system substrate-binding protein